VSSIFGIDVSHHNEDNKDCFPHCKINWASLQEQGVYFAYTKASQGTKRDPRFGEYWADLGSLPQVNRVFRGAYHFLSSDGAADEQASYFLKVIGTLGAGDLPPSLDLEWDIRIGPDGKVVKDANGKERDFWDRFDPDEIIYRALTWLKSVRSATNRTPIVYTNKAWWDERIKDEKKFARLSEFGLWVAAYPRTISLNEKPSVPNGAPWKLWQFTDRAIMAAGGLVGSADANIFKGTPEDFQKEFGLASK
jgi:lysozyme